MAVSSHCKFYEFHVKLYERYQSVEITILKLPEFGHVIFNFFIDKTRKKKKNVRIKISLRRVH